MSCPINCNEVAVSHDAEDLICLGARPAGSSSIIIFWCLDSITDITDPAQILLAISLDQAILVTDIRFGNAAATPTTGPKLTSCGTPGVLYQSYPLNLTDYSYNQTNMELYDALGGGRKAAAILAWDCNTKPTFANTSRYYLPSAGGITFSGGLVDPDDDDEAARFELSATYKGGITIIPTPAGIFA